MSWGAKLPCIALRSHKGKQIFKGIPQFFAVGIFKIVNFSKYNIGHIIYEFETSDQIQKYYSNLGNNDVPYPVAVGEKNAYFMLDRKYVAKENIYRNVKSAKKFKISTCSPFYRLLTKKYSKDFTEEEWADCYGYYYRNNFKDVCNF